ncbi:hypothetical protein DAPPUDRAFT_299902 [Daphnia pulex]|uniref:Pentatricopeptide repeat-containing protein 2, mitochondrial n=1 Tax=Daphnia pulex TaxID=6669 RepID=E9FQX6_DAPPU|nr:hypothetical protein DAPPUDRAFT_299902 [Daphnia pulex]|eukprot:EFX90291.1 hypothetical protein DAPPUDRAFT_299902 [Daphnia pulex]
MMQNITSYLVRASSQSTFTQLRFQGLRSLYTAEALGLDGYATSRSKTAVNFHGTQMKEKFRTRMQEFVGSSSSNLIFTDDLKTMVNLAENTPEDIQLLEQMIEKFHSQSTGLRFGTFVFGPVIMRFLYSINETKALLSLLRNPKTVTLFDQFISYQIAMDLLLENKMYKEVLEVFDIAQKRNIQDNQYPKNCFIIVMAALCRQNTPESYQEMKTLLTKASSFGHIPMRRALTYAASLALKQNDPKFCMELLSECKQQNYVTVRNLKAVALAKLDRFDDCVAVLRAALEYDRPAGVEFRKRNFFKDVIDTIDQEIKGTASKDVQLEYDRVVKTLRDRDMIEDQILDSILDHPIDRVDPRERDNWGSNDRSFVDRGMVKRNFNKDNQYERNARPLYPPRRPGLNEME